MDKTALEAVLSAVVHDVRIAALREAEEHVRTFVGSEHDDAETIADSIARMIAEEIAR